MADSFQHIIASLLEFETPADEANFTTHVFGMIEHARRNMGWEKDNCYRPGSFLHNLDIWQKKSEQDYTYRAATDPLFRESNIAPNAILTQINQHVDRLSNDLLGTPTFFTAKPQGGEDQNPAIDYLKERLFYRSKHTVLHETCQFASKGAFTRGQEIVFTTYNSDAYLCPKAISVIKVDGKVLKDGSGHPVVDADKWIKNPLDANTIILERELDLPNKIVLPADVVMQVGNKKVIKEYKQGDPGAVSKVIHYGDFFTILNSESLENSPLNGHAFRSNVGTLLLNWDESSWLPGAKEYLAAAKNNTLPESNLYDYAVQATQPLLRNGEDEELGMNKNNTTSDPNGYNDRSYYYGVIRYDVDKDGQMEDVYFIADVACRKILQYEYAQFAFPWNKAKHPLPYNVVRIWPRAHRWYGMGSYELLECFERIEDRNVNRIEIDSDTSGNVVFEDLDATTAGIDGSGIQFRSREAYSLRANRTAQEALQVVTVAPANIEIFSAQADAARARIELMGGTTSPQDSTTTDIPGSDTLGVAKILENTANISLRARESEIVTGLTRILQATASIEKWSALLEPNRAIIESQLGPDKAAILIEWLATTSDNLQDILEINLSKSSSSQMIEINNAVLNVMDRWKVLNPLFAEAEKPLYENILSGMDVANPDKLLNIETLQLVQQQMAEAAMAAEAAKGEQLPP